MFLFGSEYLQIHDSNGILGGEGAYALKLEKICGLTIIGPLH